MTVKYKEGFRKEHWSEYQIWKGIRKRCYNKNFKDYKIYGGKGIIISEEWLDSFEQFYNDMGPRPSKDHSIDRKDPNGNYCKDNCRWATVKEQARNKTNNVLITYNGESKTLMEWAEVTGISFDALRGRLFKYNWGLEKAFTLPSGIDKTRRPVYGEVNKSSKLTEKDVLEIYHSTLRPKDLMEKYKVTRNTIWKIKTKQAWKHTLNNL